jgi:hypothetical protein
MDGGARRDRTADLVNAIFGFGISMTIPMMAEDANCQGRSLRLFPKRSCCFLAPCLLCAY